MATLHYLNWDKDARDGVVSARNHRIEGSFYHALTVACGLSRTDATMTVPRSWYREALTVDGAIDNEALFAKYQHIDSVDFEARSMSVGDVIERPDGASIVLSIGFAPVRLGEGLVLDDPAFEKLRETFVQDAKASNTDTDPHDVLTNSPEEV